MKKFNDYYLEAEISMNGLTDDSAEMIKIIDREAMVNMLNDIVERMEKIK